MNNQVEQDRKSEMGRFFITVIEIKNKIQSDLIRKYKLTLLNTVTFKVDRALDVEYPTQKYGVFLDLTADSTSGTPAMALFTFKGGEFMHNWLQGVGGRTGLESGPVASPVAGTKLINWGLKKHYSYAAQVPSLVITMKNNSFNCWKL